MSDRDRRRLRRTTTRLLTCFGALIVGLSASADPPAAVSGRFDPNRDLLLVQFDSKTDVDDLHSVAAVATLLSVPRFENVRRHAVAGAYGIQDGDYVPSPALFESAFGDAWSDAHGARAQALAEVSTLAAETVRAGGAVWVAEAGQSDFTADWLKAIIQQGLSPHRVHVVQHSDWNEDVTSPDKLAFVRENANYHKIPDGNVFGNGTPGFKIASGELWPSATALSDTGDTWRLARAIANHYNGLDGRYLNEAIEAGGMDFSDTVETCWILGIDAIEDAADFFGMIDGDRSKHP